MPFGLPPRSACFWSLGLQAPGNRGWPLLSDSAGATRVLYCSPSQANAVAEVRGYMVEDCGIVEGQGLPRTQSLLALACKADRVRGIKRNCPILVRPPA